MRIMNKSMKKNMKKRIKGVVKTRSLLVLIVFAAFFTVGCRKQNDTLNAAKDNTDNTVQNNNTTGTGKTDTEKVNNTAADVNDTAENVNDTGEKLNDTAEHAAQVINNGGFYVKYNGDIYYRQYTADSYASDGIFGTYESVPGVTKTMVRLKQDGTKETAFLDSGEGNIFIYKDRMYLEKLNEEYTSELYSVNLDGTNEQIIGTGRIEGIDEKTGIFVCMMADEGDTYQLFRLDSENGETVRYDLAIPCAKVLAIKDGVIYYTGKAEDETVQSSEIKLCSVNADGTDEKLLAEIGKELYEYADSGAVIPCIQFVGETVYFAYGTYGGTGNFYGGGQIAKVNKDGGEFSVLAGGTKDGADDYENMINDVFYVASKNGEEILYFSTISENSGSFALHINSGEIEKTDFLVYPEGKPFVYKDSVNIYLNSSPGMITWIPDLDYSYQGLEKEADYYSVDDIELCDNWIYYKLEANKENPDASIGWRDGYHRLRTKIVRRELEGDKVETLFEY